MALPFNTKVEGNPRPEDMAKLPILGFRATPQEQALIDSKATLKIGNNFFPANPSSVAAMRQQGKTFIAQQGQPGQATQAGANGAEFIAPNYDNGSQGGGGGGGMSSILRARQNLANQIYKDAIAALDEREGITKKEADFAKRNIEAEKAARVEASRTGELQAQRAARQNFQDANLQLRRRARATGSTGSAFAELNNELDQQFNQTLADANTARLGSENNARMVAQKALGELEIALLKTIADINRDRALAKRERDKQIAEAQIAAISQAAQVRRWAAQKADPTRQTIEALIRQGKQDPAQIQALMQQAEVRNYLQGGAPGAVRQNIYSLYPSAAPQQISNNQFRALSTGYEKGDVSADQFKSATGISNFL